MLRLRFAPRAGGNCANLSFVESGALNVGTSISLLDTSYTRIANLSTYLGGDLCIPLAGGRVDTNDLVISPRAVLSRNIRRPAPLYYKYAIGRGAYHIATSGTPANTELARSEILNQIQILDRMDKLISGPDWDIEVIAMNAAFQCEVVLYLSRRQAPTETFKIRYQAVRISDGYAFPNHIEVVNATPILEEGVDYTLQSETDGYSIQGMVPAAWAQALGLFYNGTNPAGQAEVLMVGPVPNIRVWLDTAVWWTTPLTGKSAAELSSEINEARIEYEAVPLSSSDTPLTTLAIGVFVVSPNGTALRHDSYAQVRYREDTRVRLLKPYSDQFYLPWYPRIDRGEFQQDATIGGAANKLVFKPQGPTVTIPPGRNGVGTYDRLDEQPSVLGPKMVALRRPNFLQASLVLSRGGQDITSIVGDFDQLNSILFLSQEIGDTSSLFASYSYVSECMIYTGVNLNPLRLHSPEVLDKYIGIYLTPAEVLGPSADTLSRTVWHVICDTIPEVISAVAGVKFTGSADSAQALLLGIYHVSSVGTLDEIKMVDTRTQGGGISDVATDAEIEEGCEARMVADVSPWDGEPFPPTAVVVQVPEELVGEDTAPMHRNPLIDSSEFFYPVRLLTYDQIQAKMNRYKAAGVTAIVDPESTLNA